MDFKNITRAAGGFTLGAFALNLYIGLYDTNLSTYQPLHWDLNWVLVAAGAISGFLLIRYPRSMKMVLLGGVVWPIAYVASLAIDVYTRLCLGGNQLYCYPSKTAALDYLIYNNANIPGAIGWKLWPDTIPLALAFLAIAFVISAVTLFRLRKEAWRHMPSSRQKIPIPTQPKPVQRQPSQIPGQRIPQSGNNNNDDDDEDQQS
jgi:hypothetical protein